MHLTAQYVPPRNGRTSGTDRATHMKRKRKVI